MSAPFDTPGRPTTLERRPRPLRIAHVLVGRYLGGMERYALELSQRLEQRGFANTLIVPPDSPLIDAAQQQHIACTAAPIRGDLNVFTPPMLALRLRRLGIDLLNVHDNGSAVPCSVGGKLAGIPVVGTVHAYHDHWPFLAADHLITVSDALRRHLLAQGLRAERITVVRSGVDLERFQPQPQHAARRALGLPAEGFHFAYVGRLALRKGLHMLVDAFHRLRARAPHARLLIAGTGPLDAPLRAQVLGHALDDAVHFLGFQADVRPVLAATDCLVLPSESEGLPLILLEAMAAGRATLATDVGGMPEVVRDGHTGLLIPPRRPDALEEAMARLLDDPAWTAQLGAAARHSVEQHHSLEGQIDGVEAVYRRMLKK